MKNALHSVDEVTRYQTACWLPTTSADSVLRALRMCWIDLYVGPPDIVLGSDPLRCSTLPMKLRRNNVLMVRSRFGLKHFKQYDRPKFGTSIEVYWPLGSKYYSGTITESSDKDEFSRTVLIFKMRSFKKMTRSSATVITKPFSATKKQDIYGLLEKGVFEAVTAAEAHGHRIYGSCFVDNIKNDVTRQAFAKS